MVNFRCVFPFKLYKKFNKQSRYEVFLYWSNNALEQMNSRVKKNTIKIYRVSKRALILPFTRISTHDGIITGLKMHTCSNTYWYAVEYMLSIEIFVKLFLKWFFSIVLCPQKAEINVVFRKKKYAHKFSMDTRQY